MQGHLHIQSIGIPTECTTQPVSKRVGGKIRIAASSHRTRGDLRRESYEIDEDYSDTAVLSDGCECGEWKERPGEKGREN